jgi:hypothetical protein
MKSKDYKYLLFKFNKLLKNQNNFIVQLEHIWLKVNERWLSVKLLSMSTEMIGKHRRALTDVLIFVISKILQKK